MNLMNKAFSTNGISIAQQVGIFYSVDAPDVGVGAEAPLGSLILQVPTSGEPQIWKKFGRSNTAWKKLQMKTYSSIIDPDKNSDCHDSNNIGMYFEVGDIWINVSNLSTWICIDSTINSSKWIQLSSYEQKEFKVGNFISYSRNGKLDDSGFSSESFQAPLVNPLTGTGIKDQIAIFIDKTFIKGVSTKTAFNIDFETKLSNIQMNGATSVGTLDTVARADHVHPIDMTRAADASVFHISKSNEFVLTQQQIAPSLASHILIEDSTDNFKKKYVTIDSLPFLKKITDPITGVGDANMIAIFSDRHNISGVVQKSAFNVNFETDISRIKMNGDISLGFGSTVAYANHVHPTDISRASDTEVLHINKASEFIKLGSKQPHSEDKILVESAQDGTKKYITIGSLPFKETLANQLTGEGNTGQIAIFNNGKLIGINIIPSERLPFNTTPIKIKSNGIADVGSTGYLADAGHIHPIDITRAADAKVFHVDKGGEFIKIQRKGIASVDDMIILESVTDGNEKRMITIGALPFQMPLTNPITGSGNIGQIPMFIGETEIGGITLNTGFNAPFESDAAQLKKAGVASAGTGRTIARADHVHPTNFSTLISQAYALSTDYINTSGSTKMVTVTIQVTLDTNSNGVEIYIDRILRMKYLTTINETMPITFMVPNGMSYNVTAIGNASLVNWMEIF